MSVPNRMSEQERTRRIAQMTEPVSVRLVRLQHDGTEVPVDLSGAGEYRVWGLSQIADLERWTFHHRGVGRYRATVIDAMQQILQWEFWCGEWQEAPPMGGTVGLAPTMGTITMDDTGIRPSEASLTLPNGITLRDLAHWHCELFHTQVPWGGGIVVLECDAEIVEALVYGAGVLVPPQASAQHELGDLLVEVRYAADARTTVLRAPVQALAQRQTNLWNLEEFFAPLALWSVAAELGERLRQTTVGEIAEGTAQALANLTSVREYLALIHAEYAKYVAATGPGTSLPARVRERGRLWLTHETTVSRGGGLTEVERPMGWHAGFLVETTALIKERR